MILIEKIQYFDRNKSKNYKLFYFFELQTNFLFITNKVLLCHYKN